MKTLGLLFFLLPALALAQPAPAGGCSLSATCAAKKFQLAAGNTLCLNRTTCTTTAKADATTAGFVLNSGVANSGTNVAYILDTTLAISGSTLLFSLRKGGVQQLYVDQGGGLTLATGGITIAGNTVVSTNLYNATSTPSIFGNTVDGASAIGVRIGAGPTYSTAGAKLVSFEDQLFSGSNVEHAYISKDGDYVTTGFVSTGANGYGTGGTSGATQGFAFSGNDTQVNAGSTGNNVFLRGSDGTYLRANVNGIVQGAALNPVPSVHAAVTGSPVAIEMGSGAANASGVKAITFATAFAIAPNCMCTDQNAAPVACGISTAATGSGVTFTIGSARADTVQWFCIGNK